MSSLGRDSDQHSSDFGSATSDFEPQRQSEELRLVGPDNASPSSVSRSSAALDSGFEVDSLQDNLTADGELTLREAIRNANANPDANTITFVDDIAGGTIALTNGQLEISSSVTIEGGDQIIDQTTDELSGGDNHRVLLIDGSVAGSEIDVRLEKLGVTGGYLFDEAGAGILATESRVTISELDVFENSNVLGPGAGIANSGSLDIKNSLIHNNNGVDGAAIFNFGSLNIQRAEIKDNLGASNFKIYSFYGLFNVGTAHLHGVNIENNYSGIFNSGYLSAGMTSVTRNDGLGGVQNVGHFVASDSIIDENVNQLAGGGINNNGIIELTRSLVTNNYGGYYGFYSGGGINNRSVAHLENTIITGNRVSNSGGGISNEMNGDLIISMSLIGNNHANFGGGIANFETLKIVNSTILTNEAYNGGGILNYADLSIEQTTINGNVANAYFGVYGAGISNEGQAAIENSIVAGSQGGADVFGNLVVHGTNIVEDGSLTGANVINADPILGPLQDNGGATFTLALLPGSPAIDAADPAIAPATDQRGFARDATADIGAFELQVASPADDLSYVPVTAIPDAAVLGTEDDNRLDGTMSAEFFNARAGSDDELGDGGNDVFLTGPGRDFIGGGGGQDTALFDGLIDDFDGLNFDGDLTYFVTDTNPTDGDSGRDRLGGVETFEFKDALFDAATGEVTPKTDGQLSYIPVTPNPGREAFGTEDDNRLVGSKAAEFFDAGAGRDDELGDGGDDVFLMGPGRDFIGGGGGQDTALFDGLIDDYDGLNFDGDLTYFITDTNPADGDSGRDRLGGVETFEFRDALFDATTGDITPKEGNALTAALAIEQGLGVSAAPRLEGIVIDGAIVS